MQTAPRCRPSNKKLLDAKYYTVKKLNRVCSVFIQDILNFPYNKLIENNYLQFIILMNDSVVVVDVMYRYLHISNILDNTFFSCDQNM